jgi:hypothetical protein
MLALKGQVAPEVLEVLKVLKVLKVPEFLEAPAD